MTILNTHRAARFAKALRRYGTDSLIDLLADARHWCDREGECFSELDRIAHDHYLADLFGERGLS